jgi:hypothetical protein
MQMTGLDIDDLVTRLVVLGSVLEEVIALRYVDGVAQLASQSIVGLDPVLPHADVIS